MQLRHSVEEAYQAHLRGPYRRCRSRYLRALPMQRSRCLRVLGPATHSIDRERSWWRALDAKGTRVPSQDVQQDCKGALEPAAFAEDLVACHSGGASEFSSGGVICCFICPGVGTWWLKHAWVLACKVLILRGGPRIFRTCGRRLLESLELSVWRVEEEAVRGGEGSGEGVASERRVIGDVEGCGAIECSVRSFCRSFCCLRFC